MRITIESTTKIVELVTSQGAMQARVWEGTTESGIPVYCLVTRIAVHKDQDAAPFERELQEQRPPSPAVDAVYPARMVL